MAEENETTPEEALRSVYSRLYSDDVEELKRRAAERGFSWQAYLRKLVHRALWMNMVVK